MIKLKCNGEYVNFEITRFPDGTSQAWKINKFDKFAYYEVEWYFENESELVTILQLGSLLNNDVTLKMPFLVYGRQDKKINNESTFALETFTSSLRNVGYNCIVTYDAHSTQNSFIQNIEPINFINHLMHVIFYDYVIFPDKGAKERYSHLFKENEQLYCEKNRDQLTGNLISLDIKDCPDFTEKSILVYDDICDGGGTFLLLSKSLKTKPRFMNLAVTHGIFSKGKDILYDAGYKYIYTTNSLLQNKDEFNINF